MRRLCQVWVRQSTGLCAAQRADEPGVTRQPAGTARKGKRQQCACVRAGCGGKAAMSCFGARLFATATIPLESSLERWIE